MLIDAEDCSVPGHSFGPRDPMTIASCREKRGDVAKL